MHLLIEGLAIGLVTGFLIPVSIGALGFIYVKRNKEEVMKLVMRKLMQKAKEKKQQQPPSVEMIP